MPGRLVDGVWFDSVTGVIPPSLRPDLSHVPEGVLEHARLRGQALHRAIELHERQDDLDPDSLHEEIRPGFEAYLRFTRETGWRYEAGEMELVSPTWRLVGHPDAVGWFGATRGMIDVKYVANFGAAYRLYASIQLAGYAMLWKEEHPMEPIGETYALWLRSANSYCRTDGEYRVVKLDAWRKETVFQACCVIAREAQALRKESDGNAGNA